jgi:hypothetical protein
MRNGVVRRCNNNAIGSKNGGRKVQIRLAPCIDNTLIQGCLRPAGNRNYPVSGLAEQKANRRTHLTEAQDGNAILSYFLSIHN